MDLGERIATLREERALTQAELAEKAGISPSTLSLIESGKVPRPHVGTVRKIARALGVEPKDLRSTEELVRPKVERRSSPEPSFNDVIEERRLSRFAAAITETVDKWTENMSARDADPRTVAGMVDAVLTLHGSISELMEDEERRKTLTNQEGDEILTVLEELLQAASTGVHRLEESAELAAAEETIKQRREQIKEWTREIA